MDIQQLIKEQGEKNREKYPYVHGTSTVSGHHHVTDIDQITQDTAQAVVDMVVEIMDELKFENSYAEDMWLIHYPDLLAKLQPKQE